MTAIDWQFVTLTLTHSADLSIVAYAKIHAQFDQMSCIDWLNELLAATMAIVCVYLSFLAVFIASFSCFTHFESIAMTAATPSKHNANGAMENFVVYTVSRFLGLSVDIFRVYSRYGILHRCMTNVSMYWSMFFVSSSTCSCRRHLESMFFFISCLVRYRMKSQNRSKIKVYLVYWKRLFCPHRIITCVSIFFRRVFFHFQF